MKSLLIVTLTALAVVSASASPQGVLRKFTFDSSAEGWTAIGSATASVVTTPGAAKEGSGALKLEYNIAKGDVGALVFAVAGADLTPLKSLRFWVKADYSTTFVLALEETGGGRWIAPFAVNKSDWVRVELAVSDFTLMHGADDPKDANGKLDLDRIGSAAIGDFSQYVIQMGDEGLATMLGVKSGKHVLWIDELEVSGETLPPAVAIAPEETRLDSFARPLPLWVGLGRTQLAVTAAGPLAGRALEAAYEMPQGAIAALVKPIPRGALGSKASLSLSIASKLPVTLLVQVEEAGGGKYNTMINLKGNRAVETQVLQFSEFQPSEDSKDTNGKLDVSEVVQILIADLGALIGNPAADNTVWLNNLKAVAAK